MSECEFKEICPTPNYWVEKQKDFIERTCNTEEHKICLQRTSFVAQNLTKGSEEWKRIVEYFEERKKKYPPYGVINLERAEV